MTILDAKSNSCSIKSEKIHVGWQGGEVDGFKKQTHMSLFAVPCKSESYLSVNMMVSNLHPVVSY